MDIDAHPSRSPRAAAVSPRGHRAIGCLADLADQVGFLADLCTNSARFLSDFWAEGCILFCDELWHLAVVICTPYTSAADFSADASHLSGGGGIVTSQHVAVTIRLPSWVVPSSSSSTPNVMSTNSFSSPPMREYFGFSRHHTTSGLFRVPQAHRPM